MSKKLRKDFKAVSWDYVNWFMTRKYISRLQVRIYNAALKQEYGKMRTMQKKLLNSPYSKLLSVFTVLQYIDSNVLKYCKITRQEISSLCQHLTVDQQFDKIYVSSFFRSIMAKNLRQIIYNVIQQSQQFLAELAIKPEWKAKCFEGFHPFIVTTGNNKNISAILIQELHKAQKTCILSLDFNMYSDYGNCLTILNTIKSTALCKIAIKRWLKGLSQTSQMDEDSLRQLWNFTSIKRYIWPIQIVIYLFIHELLIWLSKKNIGISFTCFKHNSQLLFLDRNSAVLRKIAHFINDWPALTDANTRVVKMQLCKLENGFEFQGCKIQKKSRNRDIVIAPAPRSRRLLAKYLTKIIKESKHLSVHQLIRRLSSIIMYWGKYFKFTQCSKTFRYLDYLTYTRLWLWALKQHPM